MKKTFLYVLMLIFVSVSFLHAADNFYEIFNEENASCSAYPKSGAYIPADNSFDDILNSNSADNYYADITFSHYTKVLYVGEEFIFTWKANYNKYGNPYIVVFPSNSVFYTPEEMDNSKNWGFKGAFIVYDTVAPSAELHPYDELYYFQAPSLRYISEFSFLIKALEPGIGYIYAYTKIDNGSYLDTAVCKIIVKDKIKKISLDRNKLDLYTGQKKTLTAAVNPENSEEELKWEKPIFNDNVEIGHMTERSAEIIGKKEGQAKITVTNKKNKAKDTCDVNVYQTYFVEKDTLGKYVSMRETLNVRKKTDKDEDKGYQLIPGFKKNNRYYPISNMKFTWTKIDKDNVLSLDKNTGTVKVIGTGKATVIAESEDGTRIEQTFECKNVYYAIKHSRGYGDFLLSEGDTLSLFEMGNHKMEAVKDVYLMWRSENKCVEFDGSHTYETQVLAAKPGTDTISVIGYKDNNREIIEASISIEVDKLKYIIAAGYNTNDSEIGNAYNKISFGLDLINDILKKAAPWSIVQNFVMWQITDHILEYTGKTYIFNDYLGKKLGLKKVIIVYRLTFSPTGKLDIVKVHNIKWQFKKEKYKDYLSIGDDGYVIVKKYMPYDFVDLIAYNNYGQGEITLNFTSPVPYIEIRHGESCEYTGDIDVNVGDLPIRLCAFVKDWKENTMPPIVPADFNLYYNTDKAEIIQNGDEAYIKPLKEGEVKIFAEAKDDHNKITYITVNIHNNTTPKLNKTSLTLTKGQSDTLKITVSPIKGTAIWSSSNSKVASVDKNGKVTGIKAGTATVTAKISGKTVKCKVTVKDNTVKVTGIKLSHKTVNISKGEIFALKAKGSPSDATDKKIYWESSNTKIVQVNAQGKIKGIKKGTAYIKVTTNDGGFSDICKVTVK